MVTPYTSEGSPGLEKGLYKMCIRDSFYISDTIIGITDIGRAALKRPHLWIWLTYVLGQMGIIYGVWIGFTT